MPMETTNAATLPSVERSTAALTILLVCEHQEHRQRLTTWLQGAGHQVCIAPGIRAASRAAASGDLIIFKHNAVTSEVFQALADLQKSEAAWTTPVIVLADHLEVDDVPRCFELGVLDCVKWPIERERLVARTKAVAARKEHWQTEKSLAATDAQARQEAELLVNSLIPLGLKMVREADPLRLLETILLEGMRLTDCEGGTIYSCTARDTLEFVLVRNDMLDINMGGTTGKPITFQPLPLHTPEGKPNHQYVSAYAALTGQLINIKDAYSTERFDFSGTRQFDTNTGYHSQSFLTVPLKNDRQQVIGVLQLINARDPRTGVVAPFPASVQPTIEAFAILAAAVLQAYQEKQKS